jgi:hypothetical protein
VARAAIGRVAQMTELFPHVRGSFSIYVGGRADAIDQVRFVLAFFGEDPAKVVEQFWKEHRSGDFTVVPLFGYGQQVPRRELCTQESLVDALRTVVIEPGGQIEQKWKLLCEQMNVAWPKRLTQAA